ncbi:MAG: nitrophenyl compound nitroreductase subunit ArsF family protein [Bacteroides sp.]|nr:nitrophenyl compound nitroreductase subunit ArsF family protein [Roseburia sp.]MCM1347249.1 nitrophenyl compound nitroreductase subunit ArsF family protein [Bacteroides sp.]MCM1421750.1 nitrophenyl compound nitroreductase subunit ArsF family protein [Bacteroides sp.]
MKKTFSILAIVVMLVSCGNAETKTERVTETVAETKMETPGVEVMYFHSKQRCITCMAIEKVASETVAENYADSKVKFTVVDISTPEGEPIAEKYKIARSSLIVVAHKTDGTETVENMTEKAFANARKNSEAFNAMLCAVINSLLQ